MNKYSLLLYFAMGCAAGFAQSYNGYFDTASCGTIGGWAWDGTNDRINVDIYDSGVYVTTTPANLYRADLLAAGIGDGVHAFSLPLPTTLKDNQVHNLYARFGGTTTNLAANPRALQCDSSSNGYQYYYDEVWSISPYTWNTTKWTKNGTITGGSLYGLLTQSATGGSLISNRPVQGPSSSNYEVNTTLVINGNGGVFVQYLRATSNAITGTGSYVSVELQNPTFNATTGACTATLAGFQSINGVVTQLYSTPVVCHNGMQLRTAVVGNSAMLSVNGLYYGFTFSNQLSTGMPGCGGRSMPSNNAISQVQLGPWDNVAPSSVNANTFTSVAASVEWEGAVDDPQGTGIMYYYICRTPGSCFWSYSASFEDTTQQPNTTYVYQIVAVDFHGNVSPPTNLTIVVPASGSGTNARRGIRHTNPYWGGAGEQIDVFGGNLNYSVPLITALGRGSLQATFNLTYNSQNWVVGSGTTSWPEGVDVGYGFGWQLMLGSLMPTYADPSGMEYIYTDGSGAQYRMVILNGTVWTGNGSFYAWYDANTNRLWFRDGSFWVMGCVSAGGEPDAGTLYPTLVEDSNGNQIIIHYMQGLGAYWNDSSARIASIEDARAVSYSDPGTGDTLYYSYSFSYAPGPNGLSYLSGITSHVGTAENYTFSISQGRPLYSPAGVSFSTTGLLDGITVIGTGLNYSYSFSYDTTLNDGDLLQVQFPQGGHLRWTYANCTYSGPVTIREVQQRFLLSNTQKGEDTYTFTPGNGASTTLDDPTGAERYWVFSGGWLAEIQYRANPGAPQALRHEYYTWVQEPVSLNFYVGTLKTVLDEGQSYAQTKQTVHTQDPYGNLLTSQEYDYGNLSSPARTYTNTYLYQTNTNYSSRYIYNRLVTSILTSVTPNLWLASNIYDGYTLASTSSIPREWDSASYGTSFTYRGNLTQANMPGKTINIYYDYTGTVTKQNDNNGHSVNVATSTLTNYSRPDTLDPNGTGQLVTQVTYNSTTSGAITNLLPNQVISPGQTLYNPSNQTGTAAYTAYDGYGRVAYTVAPAQSATAPGAQTTYSYTYSSTAPWTVTATTPNSGGGSHWATTTLDGIGRTASVTTGYGTTTVSEVDTSYAPCACGPIGKMAWQSQPYAPPTSTPPGTTYSYDALGRTTKVLLADGASYTQYTYQGNVTTVTDPAGNWKQYFNDAFGNLVTVLEPIPPPVTNPPTPAPPPPNPPPAYPVASAPSSTWITSYTYDQLNHLIQVSMPRTTGTQTRTFVYASTAYSTLVLPALWLTSATNPENGTVSYTYNADGTLHTKKDAIGNTLTLTYDSYGRLTSSPAGTFTWDTCPTGATGCVNAPGQMVQAALYSNVGPNQLSFQYNYAYTPAGRVSSKTLAMQSANNLDSQGHPATGTLTASYTYDNQGALLSMQYSPASMFPNSTAAYTYSLDNLERTYGVSDNTNNNWSTGYTAANQITYGGRVYNNLLQLTQIGSFTYTYSTSQNNGQIASSADATETITYQYDALKRLTTATSNKNWGETYIYDGFGNLTQMNSSGTAGAPTLSVSVDATTTGSSLPGCNTTTTGTRGIWEQPERCCITTR